MTRTEILRKAEKLVSKIEELYNALDASTAFYFEAYHDSMLIQLDAAEEVFSDIDHITTGLDVRTGADKTKVLDDVDTFIDQLEDTVKYCQAVITAQKAVEKIPTPIFG